MKLTDFDFRLWSEEEDKKYLADKKVISLPFDETDEKELQNYEKLNIELFTGSKDSNGKKVYEGDICYISQRRVFGKAKEGSYGYNLF